MTIQNQTERLSRQEMLIRDPSVYKILIVGAGGIGSNALHVAVSTGFEWITIMDDDDVGEENLYPSYFEVSDIGSNKAEMLADRIECAYDIESITAITEKLGEQDPAELGTFDVCIIGTDSLSSRRMAWNLYARFLCKPGYWIDARMGGYLGTVYTIDMSNPASVEQYDNHLHQEVQGNLPCGEKATAPMTKGFIAGMIGQSLADIVNEKEPKYIQRYDMETVEHLVVSQPKGEHDAEQ